MFVCSLSVYENHYLSASLDQPIKRFRQEGYIEEMTRFSHCLNAKTGFVNFWSVYQSFLYWIFMYVSDKTLSKDFRRAVQCLDKNRLTAPLHILLSQKYVHLGDEYE